MKCLTRRLFFRPPYGELLESRDLLSAVGFVTQEVSRGGGTIGEPTSVYAADVDGDGDVDVVSGATGLNVWFENIDGGGRFGPLQVISTESRFFVGVIRAADVDGDGDMDLFSAPSDYHGSEFVWYENIDGKGSFGPQHVIGRAANVLSMSAVDVDRDGDLDVLLSVSGEIVWYENSVAGDVDDNGEVTFSDFLKLAANFGSTHAVWEDGDLDGNGNVEVADFLILSANFGNRRPQVEPASASEDARALDSLTANVPATDEFFERLNDELTLNELI